MDVAGPQAHLLAAFPNLSSCQLCLAFVRRHLDSHPGITVSTAALMHHDSAHLNDPLSQRPTVVASPRVAGSAPDTAYFRNASARRPVSVRQPVSSYNESS